MPGCWQPENQPAHVDRDARIAELDTWVAAREKRDKESGDITLSAVQVDPEDACHDAIVEHLDDRLCAHTPDRGGGSYAVLHRFVWTFAHPAARPAHSRDNPLHDVRHCAAPSRRTPP